MKLLFNRMIYLKILVFCCLIGFSAIALEPIQAALANTMNEIRSKFIGNMEDSLDLQIRYSSIRPAFFNSFEIRNLRFYKDGRSFFSVSRANVRFSLPKLIAANKTAIHSVNIEKPVLRIDIRRDMKLFEELINNQDDSKETGKALHEIIADFIPENADYRIRDGSILIIDNDFVYHLDRMNLNIKGDGTGIVFDSTLDAEIRYSGFRDRTIVFHTNIDIKSMGNSGLTALDADILLSSASFSDQKAIKNNTSFFRPISTAEKTALATLLTVNPFSISFSYRDGIIYIDQINKNEYIDYSFRCNLMSGIVTAHLNMENFTPGTYIGFQDSLSGASHLLDISINGNSWFLTNENGNINYNINYSCGDKKDGFFIKAYGTDKSITLNDLSVFASEKTLNAGLFQGAFNASGNARLAPFRPDLKLSLKNITFTGKESINADFEITSGEEEMLFSGSDFFMGDVRIDELIVQINPLKEDIYVLASVICRDKSHAGLDAIISRTNAQLDAILNLDSFSLYNITGFFRPFVDYMSIPGAAYGFLSKNRLDAEVFISYDFNNLVYNAPYIILKNETALGEMSISGTDKQFNLSHGVYYLENDIILLTANTVFNNPMDLNFYINASYQNISWNIDGQILDGTTLIIRDPNGLHAYGNASDAGAISGYIEGINYPVPVNDDLVYLNFYITLRFSSQEFWSLDVSYFEAHDVNSPLEESALRITGSADQDGASFREIVINDRIGMLFGNADFAWDPDFSYLQFFISLTDGYENGEFYSFEGMLRDKHVNVSSEISNMHINRFTNSGNPMLVSADANITYDSINSFNADIKVTSFSTKIQNEEIKASGGIIFTNDKILVNELAVELTQIKAVLPDLKISRTEGHAEFITGIQGIVQGREFDLEVNFTAEFGKMNTWLDFSQALTLYEGAFYVDKFLYGDFFHKDVVFNFSGVNGSLSILGGVDEMLRLEMDEKGNFYMGLSSPLPIRGSIAGTLDKNLTLDAHCNNFFIDMKTLWALASEKDTSVNFDGGFITGKIDIKGPAWNPEFYGEARGASFNIQVPDYIPQDIRPVPFYAVARGYEMTFGPAVTICGTGGGTANGWFRFEYWSPRDIGIEIEVPEDTPIPYGLNFAGFNSTGDVSGNLGIQVQVDEEIIEVSGKLLMDNTEISLGFGDTSIDLDTEDDADYASVVDLEITTGPMVEFFWPNKNDPIIRANPEMGTVLNIALDTQARQYSIVSDINIKSGELSYLGRNYHIRQGTLYLDENEREFNPYITARAEIRERVDSGPVTISIIIENQPLLSFEPRFESNPGLTQLELFSLLGQNYNIQNPDSPEEVQRFLLSSTTDIVTQVAARSDILGQLIFLKYVERQVRDFLNLDMLSIRTKFIQNAIVYGASDMGIIGTVPEDRSRVGNYFDNTTVSIGKYIGQDMFIQGTLTVKYDENSKLLGGIKFEPDIGIEWRSPFVNIRWNFMPSTPQNWFVNDNSITLSWSKTF